jgi:hypothetical protein
MNIEVPVWASGGSEIVWEIVIARGLLDEEVVATEVEDCEVDDAEADEAEDD